ncbi:hypothetical protein [Bradyrhizobium sp. 62]|uniref:PGN_0703 family putative restriction endonuclease n=1 Tax=Bradyrhizobium sp. 62 TaxID=1043588 RepID=UPI001FF7BF3D|nr:hypothetical protein [Bradyrhizobium sp. 62]MCK1367669.1 hypothetical protein [Bradyrhizobium sp. 62]
MKTSEPLAPSADQSTKQAESPFVQLARSPLVPERVLKRYGAYCAIDTRFRSAARLLQCLWLKRQGVAMAPPEGRDPSTGNRAFGSILSVNDAAAGKNFLSPAIHQLALREFLLREEDAAIDEERLMGNALSSMPLAFNLFGPLALDLKLATAVFRQILPDFVQTVERILFEHSPARRDDSFLADRTAFDVAVLLITPEGKRATIFIEVKYSESLEGPIARPRDRYEEAAEEVQLYRNPASAMLRSLAIEQFWREHMLAQLIVDRELTSKAVFMAIGPRLNRRVQAAFRAYEAELLHEDSAEDRVEFVPLTLESIIQAIASAGAIELATTLWERYCDFHRVYRLAVEELATPPASAQSEAAPSGGTPANPTAASARRALPPARRRSTGAAREDLHTTSREAI